MLDFNKIDELIKERRIRKMEFYTKIEMTSSGYLDAIRNNSIKLATAVKIAEVLNVSLFEILTDIRGLPGMEYNADTLIHNTSLHDIYDQLKNKYDQLFNEYQKCKDLLIDMTFKLNECEKQNANKKTG